MADTESTNRANERALTRAVTLLYWRELTQKPPVSESVQESTETIS